MELRYGINPGRSANVVPASGDRLPFRVVSGEPSYINVLDALSAWQLVRALSDLLGRPAAASFKHVSPAGAAVAGPLDEVMAETWGVDNGVGPLAAAYVRARDADPKSSWGDFVAVSHPVDVELVEVLRKTANDGVIAPGYESGTTEGLKQKKGGNLVVLEADGAVIPPQWERRDVFGASLLQQVVPDEIGPDLESLSALPSLARADALLGMLAVRYTQSNSVGLAREGMMIGIGAGQQSRVDCTRLAGAKADVWWLRRHPVIRRARFREEASRQDRINAVVRLCEGDLTQQERRRIAQVLVGPPIELDAATRDAWLAGLTGVTLVSDGMVPFPDSVEQAARHGVGVFVEPGGSVRSGEVTAACVEHGIIHVQTGIRLFHH